MEYRPDDDIEIGSFDGGYQGRRPRRNHGQDREKDQGIRVKISPFQGGTDPDEYLEWEDRVELAF